MNLGSLFRQDLELLARESIVDGDTSQGTLAFLLDQGIVQTGVKLLPFFQHLVVKCGERGVVVIMRISLEGKVPSAWGDKSSQVSQRCVIARGKLNEAVVVQHFPPLVVSQIINVTGAGDSFVGVLLANLLQNPNTFQDPRTTSTAIFSAQSAAILSLQSHNAVSPLLSSLRISQPS